MKVKATDYLVYDEKTKKYIEETEQIVPDDLINHIRYNV